VPLTKAALNARSVPVPSNLYSHSDQQSQWQSSISDGSGRTGWAGRIGDLLQATNSKPRRHLRLARRQQPLGDRHPR
jgi:uncharacterized protein (DUF1501 family)